MTSEIKKTNANKSSPRNVNNALVAATDHTVCSWVIRKRVL